MKTILGFLQNIKIKLNMLDKAARQLMLSSVVYITLIQIIYVLDKFIRLWI